MRLGLAFYGVLEMPIADMISCAIEAERSGFQYVSVAESFYHDASALAAVISTQTTKIKFGSSVYPIAIRTPFQIAMATVTLNEISKNRVGFIGLGLGYKIRIERYFGVRVEKSLDKMKEYVEIIRGLLSGQDFSYRGKFFEFVGFPKIVSHGLGVPILFGSSAPKMLRLAGKMADGVILNSIGTPEYFRHALLLISEAAKEVGRDERNLEKAASIVFSVADRYDEAIEIARHDVLFYLLYPELDPVIEKTPYVERVAEIRRLHSRGENKKALSLVTDDMIDEMTISGTPRECRARLRKLSPYGITLPIIRVSVKASKGGGPKEVFLRAIETLSKL